MECDLGWLVIFIVFVGGIVAVFGLLKRVNEWLYVSSLGAKQYLLPPGDMGWPFIGNMLSFLKAYKYGDPDSFISGFSTRFGKTRIYRAFMFGNRSIIVTAPQTMQAKHKRLRRLTVAPISGQEALSVYLEYIKEVVVTSLDEWSRMEQPIEFLTEMRKIAFRVMINIIMSNEIDPSSMETMEKEYYLLSHGLKATVHQSPWICFSQSTQVSEKVCKDFSSCCGSEKGPW
ncbi:hypothetical protein F0562_012607 [Nyssa sinensis]|uniref:Uncharacterized protein n=1 Tax=Nyssa sinensis TaxID=561372 RepID=A0A5J4ZVM2_9ASTE|nr:hypothetical protein F0562_012607 [Nyssa sinensis]